MHNPKIFLRGAGSQAKVILEILEVLKQDCAGIFDDNPDIKDVLGYPVLGSWDPALMSEDAKMILAIGNNAVRRKMAETMGCEWATAIHPSANISTRCSIDPGTVVMAGVSINTCAVIGSHAIINTNASVDHDCKVGDYVHISPNAALAGHVTVGEGTHIGIGSSVKQGVKIGRWSVIGAGTVVIRDVPDNVVVVGNPGRILKSNVQL